MNSMKMYKECINQTSPKQSCYHSKKNGSHAESVFVLHCIPVQKNNAMLAVTCAAPFTTRDRNARIYMRSFVHKSCSLFM